MSSFLLYTHLTVLSRVSHTTFCQLPLSKTIYSDFKIFKTKNQKPKTFLFSNSKANPKPKILNFFQILEMGCFPPCFSLKSTQTAKLLDSDGGLIGKVRIPVKAAEVMLERPGHVISPVDELRRSHRISALRADDELVGGKTYVVVVVGRIGSKVSVVELENFELACKTKAKKNGSKVLPAAAAAAEEEEIGGGIGGSDQLSSVRGNYKRWNPNLESISEDFTHSFREKH